MEGATKPFSAFLGTLNFKEPPHSLVISSVDGNVVGGSAQQAKEHLAMQLAKPVRWTEAMKQLSSLAQRQHAQVSEVGFGTVLSGLWKNSSMEIPCRNLGTEDAIWAYREEMKT